MRYGLSQLDCYRTKNVWGVDDRYRTTMECYVSHGDRICFYVKPDSRAGAHHRSKSRRWKSSITGTFQTKAHGDKCSYYEDVKIGWIDPKGRPKTYPYRVDLEPMDKPKDPILFKEQPKEQLVFITDKSKTWGVFVFPSMIVIPKEDFATLKSWIKGTWKDRNIDSF